MFLILTVGLQVYNSVLDVYVTSHHWPMCTDLVSRVLSQSQPRICRRCRTI